MARPAPSDLNYAPTFAESYVAADFATTDIDLTARNAEFPTAAVALWVMSVSAPGAGEQTFVVNLQAAPTVDVVMRIAPGAWEQFRGAFTRLRATNNPGTGTVATLRFTAFWQGGPS